MGSGLRQPGCGTVFELTPRGAGYAERVLFAFQGDPTARGPNGGLTMDASGAIYGTLRRTDPAASGQPSS